MSKYTDKFLAMMRRLEVKHRRDVDEYEADGFDVLASAARDEAADWRAMRKAWEARDKLLTVYYVSHNDKFGPCECGACAEYRKARVT